MPDFDLMRAKQAEINERATALLNDRDKLGRLGIRPRTDVPYGLSVAVLEHLGSTELSGEGWGWRIEVHPTTRPPSITILEAPKIEQAGKPASDQGASEVDLEAVARLQRRCQRGVPSHVSQLGEAHDIMAACYGTLGAMAEEIKRLRPYAKAAHRAYELLQGTCARKPAS